MVVVGGYWLLCCVLLGGVVIIALVVGGLVSLFLWLADFVCVGCCCLGLLCGGFIACVFVIRGGFDCLVVFGLVVLV